MALGNTDRDNSACKVCRVRRERALVPRLQEPLDPWFPGGDRSRQGGGRGAQQAGEQGKDIHRYLRASERAGEVELLGFNLWDGSMLYGPLQQKRHVDTCCRDTCPALSANGGAHVGRRGPGDSLRGLQARVRAKRNAWPQTPSRDWPARTRDAARRPSTCCP
jgi:hypothetical protein